jgi:predicted PurR-regulated permease PerM
VTDRTPFQPPPWFRRALLTVVAVVLATVAIVWLLLQIRGLVFMLFVALFLSIALEPVVSVLVRRGWKRSLATAVVMFTALVLSLAFIASVIPLFISQATAFSEALPGYLETAQEFVGRYIDIALINDRLRQQINDLGGLLSEYGGSVAGGIFGLGSAIFNVLYQGITIALFTFYMVAEGPKLRRTVLSFLNEDQQREVLRIWEIAVAKTGGYVYSRLILAVVSAAFTAAVLSLLGLPYAVALGVWVGALSQFVPVVGGYIALVVPVLVALFQNPLDAVWVVVALLGYQQVENFLIAPRITARTMSIHPAVAIGAVIVGGSVMGATGIVLSLPVAATIQAFVATAATRHTLVDSEALADQQPPRRRERKV